MDETTASGDTVTLVSACSAVCWPNRPGFALMDIGCRRDLSSAFKIGLAALLQPRLDLLQIPHYASRREIEAAREIAAFLHFVDRAVGERHDQSEFVPSNGSWQSRQHGGWAGVPHRVSIVVILIRHHQDAHAAWLLGHVYPPVVGGFLMEARPCPFACAPAPANADGTFCRNLSWGIRAGMARKEPIVVNRWLAEAGGNSSTISAV